MRLPKARGPLSEETFAALAGAANLSVDELTAAGLLGTGPGSDDGLGTEDAALTLWCLYELSYGGFDDVDDALEWDPEVVRLRILLESNLERRLRARWDGRPAYSGSFGEAFFAMIEADDGPSLARHVQTAASVDQVLELLRHRSVYHLKESDPVAFALPRMPVAARAALAELQYDEYGGGRPERLHAQLFADGLAAVGLDPSEGPFVDQAPLAVLEQNNAMSLFGLHRRLRGAAVGHLAAFEATSSLPCRKMAQGIERLGMAPAMADYYLEHVEADAVHEQLAVRAICGALIEAEPETEDDVWFGAFTCLDTETRVATYLFDQWGVA